MESRFLNGMTHHKINLGHNSGGPLAWASSHLGRWRVQSHWLCWWFLSADALFSSISSLTHSHITDTPPAPGPTFKCPRDKRPHCEGFPDAMIENFMDYSDDSCLTRWAYNEFIFLLWCTPYLVSSKVHSGTTFKDGNCFGKMSQAQWYLYMLTWPSLLPVVLYCFN